MAYCVRMGGGCWSWAARDSWTDGIEVCGWEGISCGSAVKLAVPDRGILGYGSGAMDDVGYEAEPGLCGIGGWLDGFHVVG